MLSRSPFADTRRRPDPPPAACGQGASQNRECPLEHQPHPELEAEQAYLDYAQSCLEASRERVYRITAGYQPAAGGTNQARHERESIVEGVVNRLSQLDVGDRSLVFGRIDPAAGDERFYIGRLGVWDADRDTVVVDWRAPVAEPFYRATGREPLGLERRRHFATRGATLLGIDDEVFGDLAHNPDRPVTGEGALIAAIEAARTGRLGDIVSTIQGEQDEIIRAALPGVLLVQGGPGTGKTVVALHRAAYLLYTHRFPLEGQGVLVIGPNRLFLTYIEQVLPSLGEAGVEISVLADLLSPSVRVDGFDDEPTAFVKGDLRMAGLLARAVADRRRPLRSDFSIGMGAQRLRLSVEESARIVDEARRRARGHNSGRRIVEEQVFAALADSAHREQDSAAVPEAVRRRREARKARTYSSKVDAATVREQLSHEIPIRELLDWMWPVLTPAHLLHDLFGSKALLRSADRAADRAAAGVAAGTEAGRGAFDDDEIERLYRARSAHADDVTWTFADVALLDEARELLGHRPDKADADEVRTYGHICIDEAQDLSPMELRMIRRRSLNGSMTVVGDIAQATGAWAIDDWDQVLDLLPSKHPVRRRRLTIGYRIPGPTMSLANRILPAAAPGVAPPRPVRSEGEPPRIVGVHDLDGPELVELVHAELAAVGDPGRVAVIASADMHEQLRRSFSRQGLAFGVANRRGLDQRVALVPVRMVKGIEVDAALIVEPARILREQSEGVRALYVALTRATKRVTVVHAEPLPELLTERGAALL